MARLWVRLAARDQRSETGVLALRECRFDAAARIIQDTHLTCEIQREAFRGPVQIELDDFRRAGTDEKEQLDIRAALKEAADDAVELLIEIREAGKIALLDNSGRKAGLCENHDARRRLDKVSAGP